MSYLGLSIVLKAAAPISPPYCYSLSHTYTLFMVYPDRCRHLALLPAGCSSDLNHFSASAQCLNAVISVHVHPILSHLNVSALCL